MCVSVCVCVCVYGVVVNAQLWVGWGFVVTEESPALKMQKAKDEGTGTHANSSLFGGVCRV